MTPKSRLFVGSMIAVGTVVLARVAMHPVWTEPLHFAAYLGLILLASGMKVTIPLTDGNGTMSVNFVFILLALMQLTPVEATLAGCLSVLVQCLYHVNKGFKPVQIAFNTANIATAILLASTVYQAMLAAHAPFGLALALASSVYFLANTLPVATILAIENSKPVPQLWFKTFNWYFPFYLFGAVLAATIQFITRHYGWPTSLLVFPVAWAMYASYRNYLGRLQDQKSHIEQISEVHLRTIETLALAIEAKDQNTHDHLCRVRVYACEIGKELGLGKDEMEALRAAALLHDIGKLAVPEYIINKPGKLTPEEFEKMKIHPIVGAEILERVNFPYPVVPVVRSHHERWDGKGYPDGLAGEQIPIGARILTTVDCLDALATDRPYRRALTLTDAMAHVAQLSGSQFDPRVVSVLERRCTELEAMARKQSAALAPLHLDIQVERGERPGAGFEENGAIANVAASGEPAGAFPRREADLLAQLTQVLGNSLSMDETLTRFSESLKSLISFDTLAVYMRMQDVLLPKFVRGADQALFSSLQIPLGEGLSGWVAQNRRPILNGNPSVEPGYLNDPTKFSKLRSALAVPLENSQGECLGVLVLYAFVGDAFSSHHLQALQFISPKVTASIEESIRFHMAELQSTTDYLTQALNARAFSARFAAELQNCVSANVPLSLILCDIDDFGGINQVFGHSEGNRLLVGIADHFRGIIRENDILGRLGADEFVIVMPGLDADRAEVRVRDLRAAVRNAGSAVFEDQYKATASFSAVTYPDAGHTTELLLDAASKSLQRAKRTRTLRLSREVPVAVVAAHV